MRLKSTAPLYRSLLVVVDHSLCNLNYSNNFPLALFVLHLFVYLCDDQRGVQVGATNQTYSPGRVWPIPD